MKIDSPLSGKVIYIDPGHGATSSKGYDSGAIGGSYEEAPLVLKISLKLKTELQSRGATVHMSHTQLSDAIPTNDRPDVINAKPSNMIVSVHLNSNDKPSAKVIVTLSVD